MKSFATAALLATAGSLGCAGRDPTPPAATRQDRPTLARTISTRSAGARRRFDEGWTYYQGFNHAAAAHAFRQAAALDPECAMAYWGIALSAGPNINNPAMDEARSKEAFEAIGKARTCGGERTVVEKDLIAALSRRYAWPPPSDRAALDAAYAAAMREAHRAHPDDPDVGALFAESLLDLHPWDQWSKDGQPLHETLEIITVLDGVLAKHPGHALANHAYVHAAEASPHPEKALPAADRLRDLVPDVAHLVHMPSHIDIRLGRYAAAVAANEKAIAADRKYVAVAGRKGFYSMYRAHNYHFLVYAALFEGRSGLAMETARALVSELPLPVVREFKDILDGFLATPYHVLVRFGRWEDMLREAAPPADLAVTTAAWRYARGVALASLGRVDEAVKEQEAFAAAVAAVPESAYLGNNAARTTLEIGRALLAGEIEYRRGGFDKAFEHLRDAVRRDDELRYDEPWSWMQPPRHALGALLLERGHLQEAEQVYRADLKRHPANGWSLHGLAEALRRQEKPQEAGEAQAAFSAAWAQADVKIAASCYCRTGS